MIKVVLDTNILISGLLYVGKPRRIIDAVLNNKIESISSIPMINEFNSVIIRDRFKLSIGEQEHLKNFVLVLSDIVAVRSTFKVIVADPDDDIIVRAAYDGKADYIVSGDWHLLELKEFEGIKIVTASQMIEIIDR